MSEETLDYHYGKHHQSYVDTLNELTDGSVGDDDDLVKLITDSEGALFNQAAQVWNHTFFWRSMKADGGGDPSGDVVEALSSAFGSVEGFKDKFSEEAADHFGSGWAWLVHDGSGLKVTSTHDADNPIPRGQQALLTLDLWEHAYYLDHRNARPAYISAFFDHLVSWDWAAEQLAGV
jgi:Fe-Mn family superoxide dismutase